MDDFDALASSLAAGLGDVRGCLILSRDGLVLGSSPADGEASVTPAWVRFAALGDSERGFAQFGGETWCYVRRGPYGAFAIAGPGARPGLVLDQMDQALLAAAGRETPEHEVSEPDAPAWDDGDEPWEPSPDEQDDVDRFSLAQEFGQLLQRGEDPADG